MTIGGGFASARMETLLATRENLVHGLGLVGKHLQEGTAHTVAEHRSSSPAEAGSITLGLLIRLDEELAWREQANRQQ